MGALARLFSMPALAQTASSRAALAECRLSDEDVFSEGEKLKVVSEDDMSTYGTASVAAFGLQVTTLTRRYL